LWVIAQNGEPKAEGFAIPARIAIVLNEPEVAEEAASALRAQGQDALALVDPMTALEALEGAERIEVLVTCLDFAPGKPNGIALGCMARLKRPGIRILFVGPADLEKFAEGLGTFLASPVTVPQVVEGVLRALDTAPDLRWTPLQISPARSGTECGDRRQRNLGRPGENATGLPLTQVMGADDGHSLISSPRRASDITRRGDPLP
jgi:hypothetical protein